MRRPRYAFYYIIIYYAGQLYRFIFVPPYPFLPSSSLPCLIGIIYLYIILYDRTDRSSSRPYRRRQRDNFFSYSTRTIISWAYIIIYIGIRFCYICGVHSTPDVLNVWFFFWNNYLYNNIFYVWTLWTGFFLCRIKYKQYILITYRHMSLYIFTLPRIVYKYHYILTSYRKCMCTWSIITSR